MDQPNKDKKVLTAVDIQRSYVRMYKQLRKFIWDVDTVEAIAKVETEAYKAFPDKEVLQAAFRFLRYRVSATMKIDEDLKAAVDRFDKVITEYEQLYAKLNSVTEVLET